LYNLHPICTLWQPVVGHPSSFIGGFTGAAQVKLQVQTAELNKFSEA